MACNFDTMRVAHQYTAGQTAETYDYYLVKYVPTTNIATNTSLHCQATTVNSATAGTVTCSDTADSVAAAAGDQFAIGAVTNGATPTPVGRIMVSVRCR